ncbi:pyrroline-5-carboxylate reductase [Clostridium paraputrificum]|uniref:Pyrroline-5-carboxylate reductase n=2 Tax=Clostridium paraputrificum TaxID=29363 RepID=A0A1B8RL97_9CLOT|nr:MULTISPECIES: pyrroline-5-carboxylate reductase [Clostridium]MDU7687317.1 pyrroline-5-carboxylate reductase [Bacillota bacterium]MDB2073784.1 pyrroline-5-carboxylate reductase [Clostridium paraputrificum]MDB2083921.1 pyrroline-5-carboxylate reductase [Clostridium paraputrificum]MDB2090981.1 pyrroline-5-carboxylate reductase [Clostridium paraputrificum]MDB2097660.1 pyrroline-5-carboxylate reductase [Clostridium paraputrificum]
MMKRIGFIGCGNMGRAMVGGLINSGFSNSSNIIVSTRTEESAKLIQEKYNVNVTTNNEDVIKNSDVIFLAVKPNMYAKVIGELRKELLQEKLIITIAAGITISDMEALISDKARIVRTMPNTPALVGEGMSAICTNNNVLDEELKLVIDMYKSFGECVELEEKDFHGFIALCGSSPAYVFIFIEAMADAAVKLGIPRKKAYKMAAQSVLGSAKMILDTEQHPGELKDMVCSPSGTTIDAVVELEKQGFRSSIIEAMIKCADKSKSM